MLNKNNSVSVNMVLSVSQATDASFWKITKKIFFFSFCYQLFSCGEFLWLIIIFCLDLMVPDVFIILCSVFICLLYKYFLMVPIYIKCAFLMFSTPCPTLFLGRFTLSVAEFGVCSVAS